MIDQPVRVTGRHALALISSALCAGCVVLLLAGLTRATLVDGGLREIPINLSRAAPLLLRTVGVASLIGVVATTLAFPVAWRLRSMHPAAGALLLTPLLLPNYIIYSAWGILRAPGSALGDMLADSAPGVVQNVVFLQAIGGLSLWAWPISAIIVGAGARSIDTESLEALRLSGARSLRRIPAQIRMLRPSLLLSVIIVALLMLSSAVPLHVAQIETYAIEVWRTLDETGGSPGALVSALPLVVIALLAGWLVGSRLLLAADQPPENRALSETERSAFGAIYAIALWSASVIIPLALFLTSLREPESLLRFWRDTGDALVNSAMTALLVALASAAIAISFSALLSGAGASLTQSVCRITLRLWIVLALVPGVLIGAALQRAALFDGLAWVSATRFGVVISHLIRFGAVAAIAGWWLATIEPRALVDARRVSGGDGLRAWLATSGVVQSGAIGGVFVGCFALSLHEIEAAVTLSPPGADNLSRRVLNQLHYLRMEELNAAGANMLLIGLALGMIALLATSRTWSAVRRMAPPASALALSLVLIGCDAGRSRPGEALRVDAEIGEVGRSPGQFIYPRAIDAHDSWLWIIDKSGRVQRLTEDGEPDLEWILPVTDNGFPVGVTCAGDGLIYIADTHQHRVLALRPPTENGGACELVFQFGGYGDGDGQFYYTTDVAVQMEDGGQSVRRYYVSEYGGNDRISVFDANREFLFAFGSPGSGESAEDIQFRRPQSLEFDDERQELIVTDAVNHRVGRFTPDGALIRWIGKPGASPGAGDGEFNHPYGLELIGDARALVAEFGNNRVQMIDVETGAGLGTYGRAGRGPGELAYPWGVTAMGGVAYVLDSGNNRTLAFRPAPIERGAQQSLTRNDPG